MNRSHVVHALSLLAILASLANTRAHAQTAPVIEVPPPPAAPPPVVEVQATPVVEATPPAAPPPVVEATAVPVVQAQTTAVAEVPAAPVAGPTTSPALRAVPLVVTPPVPRRPRFVVMAVLDQRWNTADAFDLYSEDNVATFLGLSAGYELLTITETLSLTAELGWTTGASQRSDLLGGAISRTELSTHNVIAALVGRWDALPFLAPHARLGLGVSAVEMSLASEQDNTKFHDNVIAPLLGLGVGASLQTPRGLLGTRTGEFTSLQLGLRLEVGYTLAGSAGFELDGDNDVRVPVGATSLGGLPRSGPHIHSAAFVRF